MSVSSLETPIPISCEKVLAKGADMDYSSSSINYSRHNLCSIVFWVIIKLCVVITILLNGVPLCM